MGVMTVSPVRLACSLAIGCLLGNHAAMAFPATDPTNPSVTTEAPEPTESDMRHQLQLQSGFGAGGGAGWTFVPYLSLQEAYTDNVLNTERDHRWDLITLITPGFTLQGDVPNAQVRLNYGPQIRLDARTPSQNGVTQQLAGTGLFTIVPEAFYVDARAFAGGTPVGGGFGGVGLGAPPTALAAGSGGGLGTAALAKRNQVQTSAMSISPYWLHRFGDIGTAKVGYQFSQSSYAEGNSFVPVLFPSTGSKSYSFTNEAVAQFETGERFAPFRDLVSIDGRWGGGNGVNRDSKQYIFVNRLGYLVSHEIMIFGELGYESLSFNAVPPTRINDVIWGIGATITPNPDSQITFGYGHRYGQNAFSFNGSYALSPRTRISASYSVGLQSDLLGLQGQLDLASLNSLGQTVDATTGGPLFIGTGGIGAQAGLYQIRSLGFSASTVLDRDQFVLTVQSSHTTTIAQAPPGTFNPFGIPAPPVGSTSNAVTVTGSWAHQFSEALTMSTTGSYTSSHISSFGNQQSLVASIAMQYLLSETLSAIARYSYFDRNSPGVGQTFTQNLFLVGLSKQF